MVPNSGSREECPKDQGSLGRCRYNQNQIYLCLIIDNMLGQWWWNYRRKTGRHKDCRSCKKRGTAGNVRNPHIHRIIWSWFRQVLLYLHWGFYTPWNSCKTWRSYGRTTSRDDKKCWINHSTCQIYPYQVHRRRWSNLVELGKWTSSERRRYWWQWNLQTIRGHGELRHLKSSFRFCSSLARTHDIPGNRGETGG